MKEYVLKIIKESNVFDEEQMKVIHGNTEIITKVCRLIMNEKFNTYLDYVNNL